MARVHSIILILAFIFVAANAKIAYFTPCNGVAQELCSVSEVRISPCVVKQMPGNAYKCLMKTGINASLTFDFTPNFAATTLKTMAFYGGTPFADMKSNDACGYTTCPSVPGVKQTLDYNLHIGRKLPLGTYTFNWKVWDADNASQECCFLTTIQLKKNKDNLN